LIQSAVHIIFVGGLIRDGGILAGTGAGEQRSIWKREQREDRSYLGADPDIRQPGRTAHIPRCDCARKEAIVRVLVWYVGNIRLTKLLSKSFIVDEEECLVLPNRSAQASTELVATEERRTCEWVEVVAGIEDAIPKEVVRGAVKLICS
jgi:hypothetical protein